MLQTTKTAITTIVSEVMIETIALIPAKNQLELIIAVTIDYVAVTFYNSTSYVTRLSNRPSRIVSKNDIGAFNAFNNMFKNNALAHLTLPITAHSDLGTIAIKLMIKIIL